MTKHTITFQPANVRIQCDEQQTIAEAAAQQGVDMYIGCDNAVCMICQAERVYGRFEFRNSLGQSVLASEDRVLCCTAMPQTDTELYMPSVHAPDFKPSATYACQIAQLEQIAADMWRVEFLLPAGKKADYWAGQHLLMEVVHPDGELEQVPFSIASAPPSLMETDPRKLELLIANHSDKSLCIIEFLKQAITVRLTLPLGDCFLNQRFMAEHTGEPLIMIAAGSGISQIKCLTEAALKLNPKQELHLYWSNRQAEDFYLKRLFEQLEATHPNFHCHLILESANDQWPGRSGWLYQILMADFPRFDRVQLFACGSPTMVYGTLDQLATLGLSERNMHSDVFTYAPRA